MKRAMDITIRIIMGIITNLLVAGSVKFTAEWHVYIGMSDFWSWMFSGSFIVFGNIAFNIWWGTKDKRWLSAWIVILIYSMLSTVASQYLTMKEAELNRSSQGTVDFYLYSTLSKDIESKNALISFLENPAILTREEKDALIAGIDDQIESRKPERDRIQAILDSIETKEDRYEWSNTNSQSQDRLDQLNEEISDLNIKKESILSGGKIDEEQIKALRFEAGEIQKKINEIVERSPSVLVTDRDSIDQGNIFQYFSRIFFGLSPVVIQFIWSLFPALFIDLISPISSALVFYGIPDMLVKKDDEVLQAYSRGKAEAFSAVNKELKRRLTGKE